MSTELSRVDASHADLKQISLDRIERNPDNPRILFRQEEMDELLDSIQRWGVQVPITVFKKGSRFVLIDGERRWRCCLKLNHRTIPALVATEPDRLTNMLLMFNIHGLREQWDLLTIALKLREIIELLEESKGGKPTERELSEETGLKIGVIRRARYLLVLPAKYHDMMLKELQKPKTKQVFTEDFFIEMERALTTVGRAMPEVLSKRDDVRRVLIKKFRNQVIDNRVHFRQIAKIARAESVQSDAKAAERALRKLFSDNNYSIEDAFSDSVSESYGERDILVRVNGLLNKLKHIESASVDESLRSALNQILKEVRRILKD
jgi:ParB/RepB/Spo0J family partition protein